MEEDYAQTKNDMRNLEAFVNNPAGTPNLNSVGNDNKTLADLQLQVLDIARQAANMKTYLTYNEMVAAQPVERGSNAQVTNDPDVSKNGFYVSDGSFWIMSEIQPVTGDFVSQINYLNKILAGVSRLNVDDWLKVDITEDGYVLAGLKNNGDAYYYSNLNVSGSIEGLGVPFVAPTVGDILEANVDTDDKAISYWTIDGKRWQILPDGSFGLVYSPEWFNTANNTCYRKLNIIARCENVMQDLNLIVIGDSITWGSGSSNTGPSSPRDHRLTDPRSNLTCRSWVNLLREYLGKRSFNIPLDENPEIENAPGAIEGGSGVYSNTQIVSFLGMVGVTYKTNDGLLFEPTTVDSGEGALCKTSVVLPPKSSLEVEVLGENFAISFKTEKTENICKFDVLVDGVKEQEFIFNDVENEEWGKIVVFEPSVYKLSTISLVNTSNHNLVLEGVRRLKKIRIVNQGIIGTRSDNWLPQPPTNRDLLIAGVPLWASDVFIALGTNDRNSSNPYHNSSVLEVNLYKIIEWLTLNTKVQNIVLIGAYATLEDEGKVFGQRDVARVMKTLQIKNNILNYNPYQKMVDEIESGKVLFNSNDLLHPNDLGHSVIFNFIKYKLESEN